MKQKHKVCVMCGEKPELKIQRTRDEITGEIIEEKFYIYFIDPKSKEQLCIKHNQVNDMIYRDKGDPTKGEGVGFKK